MELIGRLLVFGFSFLKVYTHCSIATRGVYARAVQVSILDVSGLEVSLHGGYVQKPRSRGWACHGQDLWSLVSLQLSPFEEYGKTVHRWTCESICTDRIKAGRLITVGSLPSSVTPSSASRHRRADTRSWVNFTHSGETGDERMIDVDVEHHSWAGSEGVHSAI